MDTAASPEVYARLGGIDYVVIAAYLALSMVIGLWYSRRGTTSADAFFIGDRGMSWWLVGISLTATCFAADTPIWFGEIIYKRGIEGAWLYWAPALGAAFYVFAIAPLWRRSAVMTDLEFLELRYSGRAATWMRGINSIYFAFFFNIMMMAVSTLSIATIMQATTGWDKLTCVAITMGGALVYTALSGLWGVAATDFLQFFVTFGGSVVLGIWSVGKAGGAGALVAKATELTTWPGHELNLLPGTGGSGLGLPLTTILFLFTFRLAENASSGAYVAQRLFAARSVRHALWAALLFVIVYYAFVPLPWIATIVSAKIVLPGLLEGKEAYPRMAMLLPAGLKGVLIASMLAAFMSTYASLLSWGSSYFLNDFYRRFLVKSAGSRHYVRVGQLAMAPMSLISAGIALYAESILNLLLVVFSVTAGYYTVQLLRWLWWRVNGWSEVAGMLGSILMNVLVALLFPRWLETAHLEAYFGHRSLFVMIGTLVVWVAATLLTPPSDPGHLDAFYRRVRPFGFWGPVRRRVGLAPVIGWGGALWGWLVVAIAVYGCLLGSLRLIFGHWWTGLALLAAGLAGILLASHKASRFEDGGESRDGAAGG